MPEYFFHLSFELHSSRSPPDTTYTPPPQTDIFTSALPAHRRASWSAPSPIHRTYSATASSSEAATRPTNSRRLSQRTRPSFSNHHDSPVPVDKPTTKAGHKRTQSFAAHKDWRYDTISILSIDMLPNNSDNASRPRAKSLKQAATSGGLATKGRFIPSDPKNTEVGWGSYTCSAMETKLQASTTR